MAEIRKVTRVEAECPHPSVQRVGANRRVNSTSALRTAGTVEEARKAEAVMSNRPEVTKIPSFRNQRKTQVAAYIRVSSTMKTQDESFENQAAYYESQISSNPEWELAGIYGEKVSGTHAENRDEFQRLIKDAMDGKIDLVLCKSVSRWARNVVDGLQSIKLLTGRGVHIFFEQEGIDTRTPGILFQLNLAASVAQSESESISENLKWSYKQKTAQGKFYANKNRYFGYDTKGDEFKINEDAECVRYIFNSYVNGMSVTEIADRLNKAGMKTGQGNDWTTSSVHCILKNEVYVGDVIFRKTPSRNIITGEIDEDWQPKYVRNHHVGIIDRETWDAAKARREANRRGVRAGTHACSGT